jgi:beta-lactamase class A
MHLRGVGVRLALSAVIVVSIVVLAITRPWASFGDASALPSGGSDVGTSPTPATPTPVTSPIPSTSPTPAAAFRRVTAWTTGDTELRAAAGAAGVIEASVGAAFPLQLSGASVLLSGAAWYEVAWATPGRSGVAWVPAASVSLDRPTAEAEAGIGALDDHLQRYLESFGKRVGVRVVDVTRFTAYSYNPDVGFIAASSIKVPIMLVFLSQLEAAHRQLTTADLDLLTDMIEESDNDAATTLYARIGDVRGMRTFLRSVGVSGLTPETPYNGWGGSTVTPRAMVELLQLLHDGKILTAAHRALALNLMENVVAWERFGVGDTAPTGATVALKTGDVTESDGREAVNSSGIVTTATETYVISVYTVGNATVEDGIEILNHVCAAIAAALT